MNHRKASFFVLWLGVLASALYIYFFHRDALQRLLLELSTSPPSWVYAVYLALGCLRGFTLIPATYLVVAGMLVLPAAPLYALTVAGIIVSSAAVYYFAEAMQFDRFFERRYGPQVARLRALMARRELPDRHRLELLSHRADRLGLLRVRGAESRPEEVPSGGNHR